MIEEREARQPGYGGVAKTLHWLIVALLIAQYTVAWTMPDIGRGTQPVGLIDIHLSIGITILTLALLRLLWRWTHPVPLISDDVPWWQYRAAQLTHGLLYFLIFLLPLLGWASASMRGWGFGFFGLGNIPQFLPTSRAAGRLGDIHTLVSYVLLGVVGLHVLAALYHHLWLRDRVLVRMLPGGR